MIRFWELFRCIGVDDEAQPFPGMVVPFGGSNIVVLDTEGKDLRVASDHQGITIEEFDGTALRRQLIEKNIELSQLDVDPLYREAMMPTSMFWYTKPRFFRIHGKKGQIGFPGAEVKAFQGRSVAATLRVVVLKPMPVKIAIRNVTVPDPQGSIVFHSRKPCDPDKERARMNTVWVPQTNITFDLVPSDPALIDVRDRTTRETLAKGFGLKDPANAVVAPELDPRKMTETFKKLKVGQADVTFFLVDRIKMGTENPNGVMFSEHGFAVIAGSHGETTFAHEVGHFLGGEVKKGQWDGRDHDVVDERRYKKGSPELKRAQDQNLRLLMRDGGASWKIPFDLAKQFRGFPDRYPARAR